jgi:hypothetical protein
MNYQIIKDESLLREFITWLPELESGECFYVSLLARSKYLEDKALLKADKASLKRFTANDKRFLLDKIKQLEVEVGAYKHGDAPVPQDALALYITPNPRSLINATKNALIKFAHLITSPYNGYNPHSEVMSEIQKACSRKLYLDFDFDFLSVAEFLSQLTGKINLDCLHIVQTIGGFHCLVELAKVEKQYEKSWYKSLTSIEGCDVRGDNLLNVPGCVQSTFVPHFLKLWPNPSPVTIS